MGKDSSNITGARREAPSPGRTAALAALDFKRGHLPHWFTAPFAECHRGMQRFLHEAPPGSASLVVAPRDHGKTSLAVVGELLFRILSGQARFAVLGASSAERARDLLRLLREELDENPLLGAFGTGGKKVWSRRELAFTVERPGVMGLRPEGPPEGPRRTPFTRSASKRMRRRFCPAAGPAEVRVLALGPRQNWRGVLARGARPDFVVLDDLEREDGVRNPRVVDARVDFLLSEVFPAMAPHGKMFLVGNLFARRAALTRLFEDRERHPALRRFRFDAEDEAGNPAWPARFSRAQLAEKRRILGEARYAAEYLNRPQDEGALLKEEEIRTYGGAEIRNLSLDVVGFFDPSATDGEKSDLQAFVTLGTHQDRNSGPTHYVLDAFVRRCRFDEAVAAIFERARRRPYRVIGVEANAFGGWVESEMKRAAGKAGFRIPWKAVTHRTSKRGRVEGLVPLIQRGELRFDPRQGDQRRLIEQLIHFGSPGMHDDGPDALAGCQEMLKKGSAPGLRFDDG
jgi:predicted phage terminase large subunit-like protein